MSFWGKLGADASNLLIGNLSATYGTGDTLSEKKRKDAQYDALEMERRGIQARVEGAKAAGLHPLAALNFQAGYQPQSVIGSEPMPSSGYSPEPERDPNIDRYNKARADLAELEVEQARRNSNKALASQPGQAPQTTMPTSPSNLTSSGRLRDGVVVEPDKVTAGRDGRTAGVHQGTTDYEMPGGWGITLPSESASQAMEDMEILKYAVVASANKDRMVQAILDMLKGVRDGHPAFVKREAEREVERYKRRYPPKGDYYISPRSRGGVVRR